MASDYWNHNVAFHRRIVRDAALRGRMAEGDVITSSGGVEARIAGVLELKGAEQQRRENSKKTGPQRWAGKVVAHQKS